MVMIGSSDDSRMEFFRAWASERLSRRRLEASASRCTMARQLDRSPCGIFTRNMKVKTVDSWPVLKLRRRLRPSHWPVLFTPGTATSRSSCHESSV